MHTACISNHYGILVVINDYYLLSYLIECKYNYFLILYVSFSANNRAMIIPYRSMYPSFIKTSKGITGNSIIFLYPQNEIQSHLVLWPVRLCVFLSLSLCKNFLTLAKINCWTIRDRDLIFDMHTLLPPSNNTKFDDLVTFIKTNNPFGFCCCQGHQFFTNTSCLSYVWLQVITSTLVYQNFFHRQIISNFV